MAYARPLENEAEESAPETARNVAQKAPATAAEPVEPKVRPAFVSEKHPAAQAGAHPRAVGGSTRRLAPAGKSVTRMWPPRPRRPRR